MALTQISTAGVKDDAVTAAKIPADAVGSSELADNAVDTAAIANDAVTGSKIGQVIDNSHITSVANIAGSKLADDSISLAKLEHGTSSNNGKFLRANNGADPTFETLPSSGIPASGGTFTGDITVSGGASALTVAADSDIRFTNSTSDTGTATKIQLVNNVLKVGMGSSGIEFYDGSSGTSKWKITGSGVFQPNYDNFFSIGDTGARVTKLYLSQGLQVGGTGSANLLDDYEEGSWTPAVSGGDGTSHAEQYGRYTKVGRLVVVSARIKFSCNGTSGNQLSVGGLPFQSTSGTGENYTSGGITYCNLTLDANRFHPYVGDGANTVYFYEMNSGAGVNIGGSFSNKYLGFSAHYFT